MFSGGVEHSCDDKGRIIVPARFREELGKNFVITRGMGKCLFVMTEEYWNERFAKVFDSLPMLNDANIRLQRHFAAEASMDTNVDAQGRIALPASLREYASIKPENPVMVLGVATRLEIWSKEEWAALTERTSEEALTAAADLVGLGKVPGL